MTEPPTRELVVPVVGFGSPAGEARITVRSLTTGQRARRGVTALAMGLLGALITLPIPLVHLFFPWLSLAGGTVIGARRFMSREIIERAEGSCPLCEGSQRFNLRGSAFRLPRALRCFKCGRPLRIG